MRRLGSLLRPLFRRRRFEDGMSEEMRFHIEQYADDLVRAGVPEDVARRRARMEFGSVDNVKDDCREARGLRFVDLQVPALHLTTLVAIAMVLGTVSVAACLVPSHRAARISPLEAMTGE